MDYACHFCGMPKLSSQEREIYEYIQKHLKTTAKNIERECHITIRVANKCLRHLEGYSLILREGIARKEYVYKKIKKD